MNTKVSALYDRRLIEQQAREWLIRLDGEPPLSPSERAALREWVERSPTHRAELLRIAKFWNDANVLSQLAIPLRRSKPAIGTWTGVFALQRRYWAVAASVAFLGVIAVVASLALYRPLTSSNGVYSTQIGEHRLYTLSDGSVIELNTASALEVAYDGDLRVIHLLQGEAHFDVAHDATRPFEVFAGSGMVRAVGTAFSVRLKQGDIAVTVAEGRVELATVTREDKHAGEATELGAQSDVRGRRPSVEVLGLLSSGHSALFDQKIREVRALAAADVVHEFAWRQGMLVFAGEPLGEVIAEVSRYTPIQIEIADPALRSIPVGGRFRAGEVESIFDVFTSSFGIRVERVDALHVRLFAQAAPQSDAPLSENPAIRQ